MDRGTEDRPILFEWTGRPPGRRHETTLFAQTDLLSETPIPIPVFSVEWQWGAET
ncbi:MAG: hypothetical protein MI724_15725 [Spirochaetales bacterium]|nr:hypothetical protein [Spirochaetales bacterium]